MLYSDIVLLKSFVEPKEKFTTVYYVRKHLASYCSISVSSIKKRFGAERKSALRGAARGLREHSVHKWAILKASRGDSVWVIQRRWLLLPFIQAANAATAHKSASVCVSPAGFWCRIFAFEPFGLLCPFICFLNIRARASLKNETVYMLRVKIRIITGAVGKGERIKKEAAGIYWLSPIGTVSSQTFRERLSSETALASRHYGLNRRKHQMQCIF